MVRTSLQILFQRLLLSEPVSTLSDTPDLDMEAAYQRVLQLLGAGKEWEESLHFELRLRLALHLAPVEAIEYDPRNPKARRELIRQFLVNEHKCPGHEAKELARDVARVLLAWDESREPVSSYLSEILQRQDGKCSCCHVKLAKDSSETVERFPPLTLKYKDEFKPYFLSPEELLSPEVDHIEPISRLGRNSIHNLQVLCRLCNRGKGDRLGLNIRTEAKYAASSVEQVPSSFRAQMLYYVVTKAKNTCVLCDSKEEELTIRKQIAGGSFVRSNLFSICASCVSFE